MLATLFVSNVINPGTKFDPKTKTKSTTMYGKHPQLSEVMNPLTSKALDIKARLGAVLWCCIAR